MDKKQLTIAILILSGTFLLIVAAIIFFYFTNPSMIGFAPQNKSKFDSTKTLVGGIPLNTDLRTATVSITLDKLIRFEEIEKLKLKQDSVLTTFNGTSKFLNDSITAIYNNTQHIRDSILNVNKRYQNLVKANNTINDSLGKLVNEINKAKDKIKMSEQRIKDQESFIAKKQDTIEKKNFLDFAKMYNTTNPQDVARILEQIDERDAAKILKLMQPKKASKVLEAMVPEQAAAILLLGATK